MEEDRLVEGETIAEQGELSKKHRRDSSDCDESERNGGKRLRHDEITRDYNEKVIALKKSGSEGERSDRLERENRSIRGDSPERVQNINKRDLIEMTNQKPEILNRNKRIFGSLMGHLGLAKEKLEKESDRIYKQRELEQSAAKKNSEQLTKLEVTRLKEAKKFFFDHQLSIIKQGSVIHKSYLESLQYFLCTSTEPKLLWLPANHNKFSKEMLARRHDEVGLILFDISPFIFHSSRYCVKLPNARWQMPRKSARSRINAAAS